MVIAIGLCRVLQQDRMGQLMLLMQSFTKPQGNGRRTVTRSNIDSRKASSSASSFKTSASEAMLIRMVRAFLAIGCGHAILEFIPNLFGVWWVSYTQRSP